MSNHMSYKVNIKYISVVFLLLLSIVPSVFAQTTGSNTEFIGKQNTIIDLKVPCFDGNRTFCQPPVQCNITLIYPNSSVLINNQAMTNQYSFNNFSLSALQTSLAGLYQGTVLCSDGINNGFSDITLIINRDGLDLSGNITALLVIVATLTALLIFFIVLAVILEEALRLVFVGLSFIMVPIILFVVSSIVNDALMPLAVINIVETGYILSLTMLFGYALYILWKLTMGLKVQDNRSAGAVTTGSLWGPNRDKIKKEKEKEQKDYEDNGEFEE